MFLPAKQSRVTVVSKRFYSRQGFIVNGPMQTDCCQPMFNSFRYIFAGAGLPDAINFVWLPAFGSLISRSSLNSWLPIVHLHSVIGHPQFEQSPVYTWRNCFWLLYCLMEANLWRRIYSNVTLLKRVWNYNRHFWERNKELNFILNL